MYYFYVNYLSATKSSNVMVRSDLWFTLDYFAPNQFRASMLHPVYITCIDSIYLFSMYIIHMSKVDDYLFVHFRRVWEFPRRKLTSN